MKSMYWHTHNLPRFIMLLFCTFVLSTLFLVEHFKHNQPQDYFFEKFKAAQLTFNAFKAIKQERKVLNIKINTQIDPQNSGLIGEQLTKITSDSGDLNVKQTTINPNIAALFVQWLKNLGLNPGDHVAVNMTGSFPALDIAMLSAMKVLKLSPLIVFSAAASQYGANIVNFSWPTMYRILAQHGIFNFPVLGVSMGGKRDRAHGMTEKDRHILFNIIKKNNYPYIDSENTIDGIDKRMEIYKKSRGDQLIKAFINVGGSVASIGLKQINLNSKLNGEPKSLGFGVITKMPISVANTDSVAVRFLKKGVAVINVHNVGSHLIHHYGFPPSPQYEPFLGTGSLFYHKEYNQLLTITVLIIDILVFIGIAILSKKQSIRYIK